MDGWIDAISLACSRPNRLRKQNVPLYMVHTYMYSITATGFSLYIKRYLEKSAVCKKTIDYCCICLACSVLFLFF